jgi:hypothetical protein
MANILSKKIYCVNEKITLKIKKPQKRGFEVGD